MFRIISLFLVVLIAAGCSDSDESVPLPDTIDMLYLGDSTGRCGNPGMGPLFDQEEPECDWSYVTWLSRRMEDEFGVDVLVNEFNIQSVASATRQFRELEPLREAIRSAEVILLSNSGDAHADCAAIATEDDIQEVAAAHRAELEEMFAELSELVDPSEVMVRSFGTPWIAAFAFDDQGEFVDELGNNCILEVGAAVEAAADNYGATAVHFIDAFNGEPPYHDGSHLLRDSLHLNAGGAQLAAEVFDEVGYAPYEP